MNHVFNSLHLFKDCDEKRIIVFLIKGYNMLALLTSSTINFWYGPPGQFYVGFKALKLSTTWLFTNKGSGSSPFSKAQWHVVLKVFWHSTMNWLCKLLHRDKNVRHMQSTIIILVYSILLWQRSMRIFTNCCIRNLLELWKDVKYFYTICQKLLDHIN